jgi:hypothetical protein
VAFVGETNVTRARQLAAGLKAELTVDLGMELLMTRTRY